VILAISATPELKLETDEDCHLDTVPVWPLRVKVVLFVPEHTDALPATLPPTETGLTVSEVPLTAVPVGVVTLIVPVVAVAGNVAVIWIALFTTKEEFTPIICTEVAPVKNVPVITTEAPEPKQTVVGVKLLIVGVRSRLVTETSSGSIPS
jgi:hypothetical protein